MTASKLTEYLDQNKIRYVTIKHSEAYTAQEIAASAHVKGRELAKTVIVKVDEDLVMAVLPSAYQVDFVELARALGKGKVRLAVEQDFGDRFPDCELGAMPPFGNLYGMQVYVAQSLAEDDEIAFNACSHTELVRMKYADFERLVQPKVLKFSTQE